jgi:hypothetical protein
MGFVVDGAIKDVQIIAVGRAIREIARLTKVYGSGRWRKLKGIAAIRLDSGGSMWAEVHWYEAHGIGRKEIKIKRIIERPWR